MAAMIRSVATMGLVASVAATPAKELSVLCRLLAVSLQQAEMDPIVGDLNLTTTVAVPVMGDVGVSVSHLALDNVELVDCSAEVDSEGVFHLEMKDLAVGLKELDWTYEGHSWPHVEDHGRANGDIKMAMKVDLNLQQNSNQVLELKLEELKVHLGAERHTWLTGALEKLTNFMEPLIAKVVTAVAQKSMKNTMDEIYTKGACAFTDNLLQGLSKVDIEFVSNEPNVVHVPLLGNVSVSVNTTKVHPPTNMTCHSMGFNGTSLRANLEDLPVAADFVWSYQKNNSDFWHNAGSGSFSAVAGTNLDIDLMTPTNTKIKVELPKLSAHLQADSDAWMYDALTFVMTPVIRESLQLFGGKILASYIEKCLEDPSCPQLKPEEVLALPATSKMSLATVAPKETEIIV